MSSSHPGWTAYTYYPSLAAAAVFIVCFAIVTLLHTFHLFRTRTWFFIPLVIGGYFELVGYIGRAMSAKQSPNWTIGPYVMQSTLLLVAPALFAASIYMELGRIIVMVKGEQFALIRVGWMTKIFVAGDVLSFLMQASGAGIMVTGSSNSTSTGQNVIIGGLIVQIVFFGFFLISAVIFQQRMGSHHTGHAVADQYPWRKHMWALHSSSMFILIRSIVRVVEYVQGTEGYLMSNEVFIYVFDGMLMFAVMVIFVIVHPSEVNYLLGRGRVVTAMGGLKVMEGSGAV
ncbi:RTA-like protein [Penicillium coprophilum]|uniref:RTA-like protein n=1 Tax=Penicillium coprophilum TaxID=36646 RepID=UPI002386BA89|nr:RTA-like protein [Penicillium coprophilum]KAJ5177407.1 RTA-like protein [Penicillium coprophilum]